MMPKFIGNDSLIARVNEVEGCMYRQSNELGRLNKAIKRYKSENAKLRELLHDAAVELYVNGNATDAATELLFDQMRELGIEVYE